MNEKKQAIIEKIQKILIQAKDQENTPEGNTFKKHAALLMAKYRIKETEIDLETDNFILDKFEFQNDRKIQPQWVGRVVYTFSNLFDCETVMRKKWDSKEYEFIGTFSDVETAMYFTEVVCNHIEAECYKEFPQKTYAKKREALGNVAASVIWDRAWELKKEMDTSIHEDKNCTALVIQKADEIKEAVADLYPNLRIARRRKTNLPSDQQTWDKGTAVGNSAPMNFAIAS